MTAPDWPSLEDRMRRATMAAFERHLATSVSESLTSTVPTADQPLTAAHFLAAMSAIPARRTGFPAPGARILISAHIQEADKVFVIDHNAMRAPYGVTGFDAIASTKIAVKLARKLRGGGFTLRRVSKRHGAAVYEVRHLRRTWR